VDIDVAEVAHAFGGGVHYPKRPLAATKLRISD
jgi:hypothetical protein